MPDNDVWEQLQDDRPQNWYLSRLRRLTRSVTGAGLKYGDLSDLDRFLGGPCRTRLVLLRAAVDQWRQATPAERKALREIYATAEQDCGELELAVGEAQGIIDELRQG